MIRCLVDEVYDVQLTRRYYGRSRLSDGWPLSGRLPNTTAIEGQGVMTRPGDIWFAPAGVLHGGEVIGGEAAVFLDIYAPPDESIIEFLRTLGEPD